MISTMLQAVELAALRRSYLNELSIYGKLIGCIFPTIMHKQLQGARAAYAAAGGDVADLGELPAPVDGFAPSVVVPHA